MPPLGNTVRKLSTPRRHLTHALRASLVQTKPAGRTRRLRDRAEPHREAPRERRHGHRRPADGRRRRDGHRRGRGLHHAKPTLAVHPIPHVLRASPSPPYLNDVLVLTFPRSQRPKRSLARGSATRRTSRASSPRSRPMRCSRSCRRRSIRSARSTTRRASARLGSRTCPPSACASAGETAGSCT